MNPHLLLEFYIAQEATFKRGEPLTIPPHPEESIRCLRALNSLEARAAAAEVIGLELLQDTTAVGYPSPPYILQVVDIPDRQIQLFTILAHGVEGGVLQTDKVCLVLPELREDPTDAFQALNVCRNSNLHINQILIFLDHQYGTLDALRSVAGPGVPIKVVTTRSQLRNTWLYYMT